MSDVTSIGVTPRVRAILVAALAAVVALTALAAAPGADAKPKKKKKPVPVKVMTRNIFLGADLGPALNAGGFTEFTEANGDILEEVEATNFPLRAEALAAEIKRKKPDLVGLQEVAWWRMNETPGLPHQSTDETGEFTATTTIVDFLAELQAQLSAQGAGYEVAVAKDEFDFEAPADTDNNSGTGLAGGDIQGRLTMRDVILVKDSKNVKVKNPQSGSFQNLFTPTVSGLEVPVVRGWTAVDATVTKGKKKKGKKNKQRKAKFRFVNSHFEAFDDESVSPSIRSLQARELVGGEGYGEGPASPKRTIILGDFNSDTTTEVQPGDAQAYQVLLDAGFSDLTIDDAENSCCVPSLFTGPASEFDHQVDHIMSNMGKKVKLTGGEVVGREQVNGLFPSDHAGVFSSLKVKK